MIFVTISDYAFNSPSFDSDEEFIPGATHMASASEIEDFDASTLVDLSRGLQLEASNLCAIEEERNGEQMKEEGTQGKRQVRMYRARHYSIGNAGAMERTPLRKSTSPYTSFEDASEVNFLKALLVTSNFLRMSIFLPCFRSTELCN